MHDGLHKRLHELVLRLQEINATSLMELCDEEKVHITLIGEEIKRKRLIEKSEDKVFAKQLMIMNNVPEKYWNFK